MANRPATLRQADVKRTVSGALAGVVAAGLTVGRIKIAPDGTVEIETAKATHANVAPASPPDGENEWDAVYK